MASETDKVEGKLKKMRNLAQYKDLTDDEFDEVMSKKVLGMQSSAAFEERIQKKLAEFERDYDLSDLKINDWDTLRALIQAYLTLEDYEQYMFEERSTGINHSSILAMDKLHKNMSDLRSDISKLSGDLSITRKTRKSDDNASLEDYIAGLKLKARKFYESKMSYVYCEKCSMLLGTVWALYGNEEKNKIVFVCDRITEDGTPCGHRTVVGTKELLNMGGTNKPDVTPESML